MEHLTTQQKISLAQQDFLKIVSSRNNRNQSADNDTNPNQVANNNTDPNELAAVDDNTISRRESSIYLYS